jgi:hypothetical protein
VDADFFQGHLTDKDNGTTFLQNVKNRSLDAVSYLKDLTALKT